MADILSISGGKDSTAMLLLAREMGVKDMRLVFMDTGLEHPFTYGYLEYLEEALDVRIERHRLDTAPLIEHKRKLVATKWRKEGVPEKDIERVLEALHPTGIPYLDLAMAYGGFPSSHKRFCTRELKKNVFRDQVLLPALAAGEDVTSWQGIRHDESVVRSCLPKDEFLTRDEDTGAEAWIYRPIIDWTAADCFAMHKKYNIEPNPLYRLGFQRVGCVPCVSYNKYAVAIMAERFPDRIEMIREWECLMSRCARAGQATFFVREGKQESIDDHVAWARTDYGGAQIPLFAEWKDPPSCSSVYGLCE